MYGIEVKIDGEWKRANCTYASIKDANAHAAEFAADGHEAQVVCVDNVAREV